MHTAYTIQIQVQIQNTAYTIQIQIQNTPYTIQIQVQIQNTKYKIQKKKKKIHNTKKKYKIQNKVALNMKSSTLKCTQCIMKPGARSSLNKYFENA